MNAVFTFAKKDVDFFAKGGVHAEYCPVGYNACYDSVPAEQKPLYDVVFVGSAYRERLELLERIAATAQRKHWRLEFAGPLYEPLYFWKKWVMRARYPASYRVWENGNFSPEAVAKLYAQSAICLNMHVSRAGSFNPRTFEIMAAGSCEIVDERLDYDQLVPGRDVVVFHDGEDLMMKIGYYINHVKERQQIVENGRRMAQSRYSLRHSLKQILARTY